MGKKVVWKKDMYTTSPKSNRFMNYSKVSSPVKTIKEKREDHNSDRNSGKKEYYYDKSQIDSLIGTLRGSSQAGKQ